VLQLGDLQLEAGNVGVKVVDVRLQVIAHRWLSPSR